MTWTHRIVLGGCALFAGAVLNLAGGLVWQPPSAACQGCAVLAPSVSCGTLGSENVVGGHICAP